MPSLQLLLKRLESHYGTPDPPEVTDPFEMILLENVAYLAKDAARQAAFQSLRRNVGVTPREMLKTSRETIGRAIQAGGILRDMRIEKLIECAEVAEKQCDGDLASCLGNSLVADRKILKKFPGIADPAADRILLFSRRYPVFTMDSNALRVLLRLGFGDEKKSYSAMYRSVLDAIRPQLKEDFNFLIPAVQLLQRHGKELCKRTKPACAQCPVHSQCSWPLRSA